MKIAIIGTGNIGSSLGRKWSSLGHNIIYGVRDLDSPKLDSLKAEKAKLLEIQDAVNASDVVVFAIPFSAVEEVAKNTFGLSLKIVIDTTNAVSSPVPEPYKSAAEALSAWAKSPKVVKAFNTTGVANLNNPLYKGEKLETYICGNDKVANALVAKLADDIGFDPVEVGNLDQAYILESMAKLWITLAYQKGYGPDFAFKIVKR